MDETLKGVRVLDIGVGIAGPVVCTLLGDFGAEVIKVELPRIGDSLRRWAAECQGVPLLWMIEGRNKKAITLDLRKPKGQEILKRLVAVSDIVVENYLPGTLEKWNLGYEELRKINQRIILVRCTGYGQEGPYKRRVSYDRHGQAMGGLGYRTGHPDSPPTFAGLAIADYTTAVFGAFGAMLALYYRDTQGQGQVVDCCIYESILRMYEAFLPIYDKLGIIAERVGNVRPLFTPGDIFQAKDKKLVYISVVEDKQFAALTEVMGEPELAQAAPFATILGRAQNCDILNSKVREWAAQKTSKELEEILVPRRIPFSRLYNAQDIAEDEHFKQRGSVIEVKHPILGMVKMQGVVPKLSKSPGRVKHPGHDIAEDTESVLIQLLGLSRGQIKELGEEGVI